MKVLFIGGTGNISTACSKLAGKNDRIRFVDVWPLMLGPDGKPLNELFIKDRIHMTPAGYELWAGEIKKFLK